MSSVRVAAPDLDAGAKLCIGNERLETGAQRTFVWVMVSRIGSELNFPDFGLIIRLTLSR